MDVFKTHGAFSWSELTTSDPAGAAAFYGRLFGWQVKDPVPEMGDYRVASLGEAMVAGIMSPPPGSPPDAAALGLLQSPSTTPTAPPSRPWRWGGQVLVPPMDVPTVGRMAVLQDPQGAVISIMQYSD